MSVRNAILGLLAHHPRHGYELKTAFEAITGGSHAWDVKPAQIYTTLSRLEEGGLVAQKAVEQEGGPEKRIYDITQAGRVELERWFGQSVAGDHQRDEFYLKLMLALSTSSVDPYQVIQVQRARLYQDLHQVTLQRRLLNPKVELAPIFLMDKVVMHLEADLRWLDMIEVRLDDIRSHPPPPPEVRPRGRPKKIS